MSSTNRTLVKAAGFLMAAQLVSRILGFFRETLIAGFYGQSGTTDAYNTAFILPDLLYWLLVGGVLSAAFIPVLSEYIAKEREEEGWRVVSESPARFRRTRKAMSSSARLARAISISRVSPTTCASAASAAATSTTTTLLAGSISPATTNRPRPNRFHPW